MRKLKRNTNNPLRDISDLQIYGEFPETRIDTVEVFADIRIGPLTEEIAGRDFRFGPTRACVRFELSGTEPERGERYSDPLTTSDEEVTTLTQRSEQTSDLNAELAAGTRASQDLPLARVSAEVRAEGRAFQKSAFDRVLTSRRSSKFIKAKPGLRWDIEARNPSDPNCFLDDTYAQGDKMFRAKVKDGANMISISAQLYCRKRDFSIVAKDRKRGDKLFGVKNREKIMAAVIARSIKQSENSSGLLGEAWIVLSTSNLEESE